jgi:hypothetical protein
MKAETDPITPDEWLIRLVWEDRFTNRVPVISPNSFEPRAGKHPDTGGISLFRKDCLNDPADALLAIPAEEKRPRYGIVQIPVSLLAELSLSVRPDPIGAVPGHVVVPELNIVDYTADKARFTPIKLRLAEVASENILRRPAAAS